MPPAKTTQDTESGLLLPFTTILLGMLMLAFLFGRPVDTPYAQEDDSTATATMTYPPPPTSARSPDEENATPYETPAETTTSRQTSTSRTINTSTATSASSNNNSDPDPVEPTREELSPSRTTTSTREPETTETLRPSQTRVPTLTQLPTETPLPNFLVCPMGEITIIEGPAPPNTAIIAYFDDRPVGGATSDADGIYRLALDMGSERPRDYLIEIRIRKTFELLREVICTVPTPTPGLREQFGLP